MHALQATLNGVAALALDAKSKETATKHAVKCLGGNVLNVMIHALVDPVLVASMTPSGGPMTADVRTKLLQKTSADEAAKVDAANRCAPSPLRLCPALCSYRASQSRCQGHRRRRIGGP